jgi:hypothetical protein
MANKIDHGGYTTEIIASGIIRVDIIVHEMLNVNVDYSNIFSKALIEIDKRYKINSATSVVSSSLIGRDPCLVCVTRTMFVFVEEILDTVGEGPEYRPLCGGG